MRIEAVGLTEEFAGKSTTLQLMLSLVRGGGHTVFEGRPYQDLPRPVREVGAVLAAVGPRHCGRRRAGSPQPPGALRGALIRLDR